MAPAADSRYPEPREDRRLKALGLVCLVAGGALVALASDRVTTTLPFTLAAMPGLAGIALLAVNLIALGLLVLAVGCGATRHWRDPRRRRAILLQLLLANLLAPALLWGLLVDDTDTRPRPEFGNWDLAATLAAYVLIAVAWRLWRRSRRHEAIDADEAMARDARAPVLYLRSFRDDDAAVLDDHGSTVYRHAMQWVRPPSPEEELAAILERIGPVVAIGRPGEPLPELGAARLYVAHDAWQQKVQDLMAQAGLVVVRVGTSPGVLWEIEQALARVPRQRLVFAMLGAAAPAAALVERLAPVLGPALAASRAEEQAHGWKTWFFRDPRRRIGGLVGFDADGVARAVPVRSWPLALRDLPFLVAMRLSAPPLRYAWRQLWQETGHGALVGARRSRALAVVLALMFGWFGAQWFYLGHRRRACVYVLIFPIAMLPSWFDALRFLWADRAEFEARWSRPVRPGSPRNMVHPPGAPTP